MIENIKYSIKEINRYIIDDINFEIVKINGKDYISKIIIYGNVSNIDDLKNVNFEEKVIEIMKHFNNNTTPEFVYVNKYKYLTREEIEIIKDKYRNSNDTNVTERLLNLVECNLEYYNEIVTDRLDLLEYWRGVNRGIRDLLTKVN